LLPLEVQCVDSKINIIVGKLQLWVSQHCLERNWATLDVELSPLIFRRARLSMAALHWIGTEADERKVTSMNSFNIQAKDVDTKR